MCRGREREKRKERKRECVCAERVCLCLCVLQVISQEEADRRGKVLWVSDVIVYHVVAKFRHCIF